MAPESADRRARMPKGDVHVVYRPGEKKWAVEVEGRLKASSLHETKDPAEKAGRATAQQNRAELLIHTRDGTIEERNTYKRDPHPPPG